MDIVLNVLQIRRGKSQYNIVKSIKPKDLMLKELAGNVNVKRDIIKRNNFFVKEYLMKLQSHVLISQLLKKLRSIKPNQITR